MSARNAELLPLEGQERRFERLMLDHLLDQHAVGLASLTASTNPSSIESRHAFRPLAPRQGTAAPRESPDGDLARRLWHHVSHELSGQLLSLDEPRSGEWTAALRDAAGASGIAVTSSRADRCRSWLGARQRSGEPAIVLTSAPAWRRLVTDLERRRLRFRLASGSSVVLIGSLGSLDEDGSTALEQAEFFLGLAAASILLLLPLPTVATPLVLQATLDHQRWRLATPPWTAAEIVDAAGQPAGRGRLAIFDLATKRQPAYQLTALGAQADDRGRAWILLPGQGA